MKRFYKIIKSAIYGKIYFSCIFFCIYGCIEQSDINQSGFLRGKIHIGPLCPVETIPPLPGCVPTAETYKAWQTSIWNLYKTKITADIVPELDGTFLMKVPSGKYIVDFKENKKTRIGTNNFPIHINIDNNDTTTIDINIDTGIR